MLNEDIVKRLSKALTESPKFPVRIAWIMGDECGQMLAEQLLQIFTTARFDQITENPGSDWIPSLKGARIRVNPRTPVTPEKKEAFNQITNAIGSIAYGDENMPVGGIAIEIGFGWKRKR